MKEWYVIQAYSGYENKVRDALLERIQRFDMEENFGEIMVPAEEVVELRGGKERKTQRKFFPGYVLVNMELNDTTCRWPIGHPDEKGFYFCGRTPIEKFVYCKLHLLYAYQPKNAKEEDQITDGDIPEFIEKKIKLA